MTPTFVIWILALAVAVLVGRDVAKWALSANKKLDSKKRAAQFLATKLRDAGLKQIPAMLEDFVIGDWQDMVDHIHEFSRLVAAGNDAIEKELGGTWNSMLDAHLSSPEGLALIKAKIAVVEASAPATAPALAAPPAVALPAAPVPGAPYPTVPLGR